MQTVADSTFVDNTGTGLGIGGGALTMSIISGGPNTAVITGSTFLRNAGAASHMCVCVCVFWGGKGVEAESTVCCDGL